MKYVLKKPFNFAGIALKSSILGIAAAGFLASSALAADTKPAGSAGTVSKEVVSAISKEPTVAPYAGWFRFDEDLKEQWKFVADPSDDKRLKIYAGSNSSGNVIIEPRHRVMILYPRKSSAYDLAVSKMLNVFADRNIEAEFIVYNFNRDDMRGAEAIKIAEEKDIDLIFTMGSQSTAWLWDNYKGGKIPVVSVTSKDPVMLGQISDYNVGSNSNFAFTSLNMPVSAQLAYVFELKPNLKNLAVLVDSKNVSAVETQARPIAEAAIGKGIRVLNLAVQQPENAKQELSEMVADAVAAMRKNDVNLENSIFWVTGSTSVFREINTINQHSDRVPVLSVVPEVVKEGGDSATMSIGISFESNAQLAAIYGLKVLQKEANVGSLNVGVVSPPDIAINFRKAREIGLKVPFTFIEGANYIFDYDGKAVRKGGKITHSGG